MTQAISESINSSLLTGRRMDMNIAFLGDSITEGTHGVSYVDMVINAFPNHQIVNLGKGGDTVKSLFRRAKKIKHLEAFDIIVLFVGVNDAMGKMSVAHKNGKILSEQAITESDHEFIEVYQNLIDYLLIKVAKIVVIPPISLGEDEGNKWNKEVERFSEYIKTIANENCDIDFLSVRTAFFDCLKDKEISNYVPLSVIEIKNDGIAVRAGKDVDYISRERGLHLTMDGTHINTAGATLISGLIVEYLNDL